MAETVQIRPISEYALGFVTIGRNRAPEPIGRTLAPILERLDREGHLEIARATRAWPEIVGEAIARRTEVSDLKFHTLVVKVSGAMWIQELSLMKPQILSRLTARLANDSVRDLRFVRGNLGHQRSSRPKSAPRAPRDAIALPELKDPDLRRAMESLIESWGRSHR